MHAPSNKILSTAPLSGLRAGEYKSKTMKFIHYLIAGTLLLSIGMVTLLITDNLKAHEQARLALQLEQARQTRQASLAEAPVATPEAPPSKPQNKPKAVAPAKTPVAKSALPSSPSGEGEPSPRRQKKAPPREIKAPEPECYQLAPSAPISSVEYTAFRNTRKGEKPFGLNGRPDFHLQNWSRTEIHIRLQGPPSAALKKQSITAELIDTHSGEVAAIATLKADQPLLTAVLIAQQIRAYDYTLRISLGTKVLFTKPVLRDGRFV